MSSNNSYCCAPQCHSWAKKDSDKHISFHLFPKENARKVYVSTQMGRELMDQRKAWILKLRIGKPVSDTMRVCSLHFQENDYFQKGKCSTFFLSKNYWFILQD